MKANLATDGTRIKHGWKNKSNHKIANYKQT